MTSSSELIIVSANVNGLGIRSKKVQMMAHLETHKPDVLFLIDTRLGKKGQTEFVNLYPNYY